MNRSVTAGELSGVHCSRGEAAIGRDCGKRERSTAMAHQSPSEVGEARAALERIVDTAHHAGDVIDTIRAMFKKSDGERFALNANVLIEEVLALLHGDLPRRRIFVETLGRAICGCQKQPISNPAFVVFDWIAWSPSRGQFPTGPLWFFGLGSCGFRPCILFRAPAPRVLPRRSCDVLRPPSN
jgi:hypothetical protein